MSTRKRTSEQEPPAVTSSAVAEPPAAANDNAPAVGDNELSFAERVGQRKRARKGVVSAQVLSPGLPKGRP
jgi:hypothetical protein